MRQHRPILSDPLFWVIVLPVLIKLLVLAPVDLFEAHTIAVEWLQNGEFRYHHLGTWNPNYQFPVYPAIVAALLVSGFGVYGVLVFQVLCGAASAWLIHRLVLLVLGKGSRTRLIALLVALCTGLSPFIAVYQVRMVHPFALDMLFALALITSGWCFRTDQWKEVVGFAMLTGVVLLNKPTAVAFLLPFAWRHRSFLFDVEHLRSKAFALTLVMLPTSLWMLRNHALLGAWSLNSATGQNLWLGVQEATDGSAQLADGRTYKALLDPEDLVALQSMSPVEQSAYFTESWKDAIRGDRTLWWRMMGVKLRNFWLFRAHLGQQHAGIQGWAMAVYKVYAVVVLVLLLFAARLGNGSIRLLLLTLLLYSILQSIFYVETRHRLVVEPMLMLIAIAGGVAVWQRFTTTAT